MLLELRFVMGWRIVSDSGAGELQPNSPLVVDQMKGELILHQPPDCRIAFDITVQPATAGIPE